MLKGYRGRNRGCEKIASIEHALSIVTLTLLNLIGSPFLLEMEKSSLLFLNSIWKRINVNGSGLRDELGQDRRENCICHLETFQFRRYTSSFFNFTYEGGGGYPPILLGLLKRGEQGASTLIERVGREELDGCF